MREKRNPSSEAHCLRDTLGARSTFLAGLTATQHTLSRIAEKRPRVAPSLQALRRSPSG